MRKGSLDCLVWLLSGCPSTKWGSLQKPRSKTV